MELDTKRNLIIGALDPRHNEADPAASGCPDNDDARRPRPGLPQRLLRHLVQRPGEPAPGRRLRLAALGPHGELHPGLQVHLDGRPGPARRPGQPRPVHPRQGFGLPPVDTTQPPSYAIAWSATAGRSGSPTCATRPSRRSPTSRSTCGATTATRTTRTTSTRTSEGIAWVAGRGGIRGYATEGRHRDPYQNRSARPRRSTRSSSPAAASPGTTRTSQGDDGTAQPVMLMHNSGRPTDGKVTRRRRQERQRARRHRGGLHDDPTAAATAAASCCRTSRTRWGGEPASQSTPREAVPDEDAGLVPPVHRHARDGERRRWAAPRTTSRSRARCSAPPGTARACACSTSRDADEV